MGKTGELGFESIFNVSGGLGGCVGQELGTSLTSSGGAVMIFHGGKIAVGLIERRRRMFFAVKGRVGSEWEFNIDVAVLFLNSR